MYLPLFSLLCVVLCVPQCLAHVEAFIDFSEDELIEDGVLTQGTCTLCSPHGEKIREQSSPGLRDGGEGGHVGFCFSLLGVERGPACFPVWIISCPSCNSVGRSRGHQTAQKTVSFRKCGQKAGGTVEAFVLPSKPTWHTAHRESGVSVQFNSSLCASHVPCVCESVSPLRPSPTV